jgi:predicted aspartyl protease
MAEDTLGMYDVHDDTEWKPAPPNQHETKLTPKGAITELIIDGKKIEVVNPEYIKETQRTMTAMAARQTSLEQTIIRLQGQLRQTSMIIADLDRQLKGKIDRA